MSSHGLAPMQTVKAPQVSCVAGRVLQRQCACGQHTIAGGECEECKKKGMILQRHSDGSAGPAAAPPSVHEVLRSPGQPLDRETRAFFEPRFGCKFSQVRVHTDSKAADSAGAVSASAYTVGNQIVFGQGEYSPAEAWGRGLLAHELTHVVQQGSTDWQPGRQLQLGSPESSLEASAEKNSASISAGNSPDLAGTPQQGTIQRDDAPVDKQKAVTPHLQIDPEIIDLGLDITKGRHKFNISGSLSQPLNLFGVNLPGLDPSQFLASLQYNNDCNGTVQSALLQYQQDQRQGNKVFNFDRNQSRVGARIGFRLGTVVVEPGGEVAFHGSQFDSVMFLFTVTTGVDPTIPTKCIPTPAPAKPPADKPGTDKPNDTPHKVPDKPGDTPHGGGGGGGEVKPSSDPLTLYFFYDTPVLRPESNHTFELLQASLQAFPSLQVVLLGHTSLEGTDAYNLKLSQSRADAIRMQLTLSGIDNSRIRTIPMGESAPAVIEPPEPKHTLGDKLEKLRDMNRRVQVIFFDPTGKFGPIVPELKLSVPEKVKLGSTP